MTEDFSTRIGTLVDEYKGTAGDIAKGLNVSKQTISAWRSGSRSPRPPVVETIARFFDVSVPWLMGLDVPRGTYYAKSIDRDRLEAMHQNPRLGLLFDRTRHMSPEAVEAMIKISEEILRERDSDA